MHGGGQTRYSWGTAAQDLIALGYHVVSLDLRGHGASDWAPDGDYRLDAFADDICAVVATLGKPPALVGASIGGLASLIAIGESRKPIASALVLVDVAPRIEHAGRQRIRRFMTANRNGFASVEEAADAVAAYLPHRPRPPSPDGLRKNLRRVSDGRLYWHWDPDFMSRHRDDGHEEESERLREAARKVTVPTLLVRGRLSDIVSPQGANDLLQTHTERQLGRRRGCRPYGGRRQE